MACSFGGSETNMYVNLVVVLVNGSKQMGLVSIPAKMIVKSLVFILHYCFAHVLYFDLFKTIFCFFFYYFFDIFLFYLISNWFGGIDFSWGGSHDGGRRLLAGSLRVLWQLQPRV